MAGTALISPFFMTSERLPTLRALIPKASRANKAPIAPAANPRKTRDSGPCRGLWRPGGCAFVTFRRCHIQRKLGLLVVPKALRRSTPHGGRRGGLAPRAAKTGATPGLDRFCGKFSKLHLCDSGRNGEAGDAVMPSQDQSISGRHPSMRHQLDGAGLPGYNRAIARSPSRTKAFD